MYKIYCDDYLIHDDQLESLRIFNAKISDELNTVGSFEFKIYSDHFYISKLQKLKSIIKVYRNDYLLFRGRIINDISGFYNERQVTCESELSFLLDSIQRPYQFIGSPAELFNQFINNHNSQVDADKQFKVGIVTVKEKNNFIVRTDDTYLNTWDSLKNKFIESLGGYLWVRHEEDGNYIDYLADFNEVATQKIEFAKNMLDFKRTVKADDIFTVIIPIGGDIEDEEGNTTGEKADIKSVNEGKDYLENSEAIQLYGRIVKMVKWENVTVPAELKKKAQEYLDEAVLLSYTTELVAADLAADNKNIQTFKLGTKVSILSKPHNIDETLLIKKISIDLFNPANNKFQLGTTFRSMTEQQNQFNYWRSSQKVGD